MWRLFISVPKTEDPGLRKRMEFNTLCLVINIINTETFYVSVIIMDEVDDTPNLLYGPWTFINVRTM